MNIYQISEGGKEEDDFLSFFGLTCGMWKFLGQGSNPSHSSDLSHSSDNH